MERFTAATVLGLVTPALVQAASITETFDSPVILSPTQAPGAWYRDRYVPAGFQTTLFQGENVLQHTIAAEDGAGSRSAPFASAFYNTQGRKFDLPDLTYRRVHQR